MIRTLFIALLISGSFFMSNTADAQLGSIPAAVTDSFTARYPNATNVAWKSKLSSYQVNFSFGNADHEARYSRKGEWESTEKVIKQVDLPDAVKDGLDKSKYYDWKVEDVYVRYIPSGLTQYHIVVNGGSLQKKNLLFSSEGRLIRDNSTL